MGAGGAVVVLGEEVLEADTPSPLHLCRQNMLLSDLLHHTDVSVWGTNDGHLAFPKVFPKGFWFSVTGSLNLLHGYMLTAACRIAQVSLG